MTHKEAGPEYEPERGDVVWLTFTPQVGREQAGRRPAVVLSPRTYNSKVGLAIVCPLTSRAKGYPFEIVVPQGLAVSGVILADQLKSIDWHGREAGFICALPQATIAEVIGKVRTLL